MSENKHTRFDQLVFSGGGLRCFWQGGFLHIVRDAMDLHPARISGVSGGAMSAAGFICHRGELMLDEMMRAFAEQERNFDLNELTNGRAGKTPHQTIYREVVTKVLQDAQEEVAQGPSYQVLIGHPPDEENAEASGSAATIAYEAELHMISSPHFDWAEKAGLDSTLVDARQAAADGRLIDLICAAATIPPIFDVPEWDGHPVVDGGMADQAPMPDPNHGRTLVLLTRQYDEIPDIEGRLYVWPSEETPADKIDFTDPDKLRRTWDVGEQDGRAFLERMN
jgi:hypothetical protein